MAVQAQQCHTNLLLLPSNDRVENETKTMNYALLPLPPPPPAMSWQQQQLHQEQQQQQQQFGFLHQSPPSSIFFPSNVSGNNARKRGREVVYPLHHPPSAPAPGTDVSTGLRLAVEETKSQVSNSEDFSGSEISHYRDEIDALLQSQGEQLLQVIAEQQRRVYRAAEESAARRFGEKETELRRATNRNAELEEKIARLKTESIAWQTKAIENQTTASALHSQIQQQQQQQNQRSRPVVGDEECFQPTAADAESAYVDPGRVETMAWRDRRAVCRACGVGQVAAVLLPCRHLCLCAACDADAVKQQVVCPVCRCPRTGSVLVFLS